MPLRRVDISNYLLQFQGLTDEYPSVDLTCPLEFHATRFN